jgi:hypothetical protein
MTEEEWLTGADPIPMLEFLRGNVSERKIRFFAVACCRIVESCLWTKSSQDAILVAERYADQLAGRAAWANAQALVKSGLELFPGEPVYDAFAQSFFTASVQYRKVFAGIGNCLLV